ncbi:MAG: HAD family hydrolase, partial [Faecalibacillus sp.]
MKKLFCFDIDGTLRTTTDHSIPTSTIKALNKLKDDGHHLLISTGRSIDSLKNTHIYDSFPFDGYVCNSGQALLDKNLNILHKEIIPDKTVRKTIQVAKENNIPLALKTVPRIITQEPNDDVLRSCQFFNNPIPQVGIYTNQEIGAMIAYGPLGYEYQEFKAIQELDVMIGESSYADITLKGISKATGIAYFMKKWHYDDYIAFGDSLNDVEMFKHASFSICMGQGNQQLKQMSSYVTDPIDQDGIYN